MSKQPKSGDTILTVVDGSLVELEVLENNNGELELGLQAISGGFTKRFDNCKHLNGRFPDPVASVIFLRCNDCGKILSHIDPQAQETKSENGSL